MKLKKYKKKTIRTYLSRELIILIMAFIFALFIIKFIASKFNTVIMPLAESKAKKYITSIINDSTQGLKINNNLFLIEKSIDNQIKMITYDSYEATKLINQITLNIQNDLDKLDNTLMDGKDKDQYVIAEIPFGVIFNNGMVRNLGPVMKVKVSIIGDVISELQTEVKPYGINNALVEVKVSIEAHVRVILPIVSKEITVVNSIPISINIVNGTIPDAYIYTYK